VSKYGVKGFRFLVDVIDMDSGNRQQSLLSTSSTRKWGRPGSFNKIILQNPIKIKLRDDIDLIGDPYPLSNMASKILGQIPNTFIKTTYGWVPVKLRAYTNRTTKYPGFYNVANTPKWKFIKEKINYRSEIISNHHFNYFNIDDKSYLVADDKIYLPAEKLVSKLILPGGNIALLTTEYSIDYQQQKLTSKLHLVTANSEEELMIYYSGEKPELYIGGKYVPDKWDYSKFEWTVSNLYGRDRNIKWEKVLRNLQDDLGIIVDLAPEVKYLIRWDKNGQNVVFPNLK
jgi:hypothetical protein